MTGMSAMITGQMDYLRSCEIDVLELQCEIRMLQAGGLETAGAEMEVEVDVSEVELAWRAKTAERSSGSRVRAGLSLPAVTVALEEEVDESGAGSGPDLESFVGRIADSAEKTSGTLSLLPTGQLKKTSTGAASEESAATGRSWSRAFSSLRSTGRDGGGAGTELAFARASAAPCTVARRGEAAVRSCGGADEGW